MRDRLQQRGWTWRVAVVALAALTLGVGFCLFDNVQSPVHHHAMTPDLFQALCCGVLVSSLALPLS